MGRSSIITVLVIVGLSALVGCGASSKASMSSVVPASNTIAVAHNDAPPPPPPGEMELSFVETSSAVHARPTTNHNAVSCKPNVQDKRGSVHAAY